MSYHHKRTTQEDMTLQFESCFESGNLFLAQKISDLEYNCLMQNDINSKGHTQWFYFRVHNTRKGHSVKFNILNYSKGDAMFNYGMKVAIYSEKKAESENIGWHRGGEDISYFKNNVRKDYVNAKFFYTATFTYTFEYDQDFVFFSYSYPYTMTDLRNDLEAIEADPVRSKYTSSSFLCKTLSGIDVPIVTITS